MDPTGEKVPGSLIITRYGPNKKWGQTEGSFRIEQDQWAGTRLDGLVKYIRQIISYALTQILAKIKSDGLLSIYSSNIKVLPRIHIKEFPVLLLPDVLCDNHMGFMKFFQEYDKFPID